VGQRPNRERCLGKAIILRVWAPQRAFALRADATLSQAAPTQNQWYTLLDTTLNVAAYFIIVAVATTAETLEVRITIDGNVYTNSFLGSAGANYYIILASTAAGFTTTPSERNVAVWGPLQARSLMVEVRKTTASGTGTLSGRVKYGQL